MHACTGTGGPVRAEGPALSTGVPAGGPALACTEHWSACRRPGTGLDWGSSAHRRIGTGLNWRWSNSLECALELDLTPFRDYSIAHKDSMHIISVNFMDILAFCGKYYRFRAVTTMNWADWALECSATLGTGLDWGPVLGQRLGTGLDWAQHSGHWTCLDWSAQS